MSSAAQGEPTVVLHHGTTRRRAESIMQNGPDPTFVEPGGSPYDPAGGIWAGRAGEQLTGGNPEDYAFRKARLFPKEGGPLLLEMEVPASIVAKADELDVGCSFTAGWGLEECLQAWPTIVKRIVPL